ncbi:GTPase family protein [Thiothrix eikelboomii]|uniref:GTPase family protein n=1 Tax=Thiothrix eikelboomii TaxID=92487 RepID=UPI003BAF1805
MRQTQTSLSSFLRLSEQIAPFIALLIGIPILVVVGFGIVSIYREGYLLALVLLITLLTFLAAIPLFFLRRQVKKRMDTQDLTSEAWVTASKNWTPFDLQVWLLLNTRIEEQLAANADWYMLRNYSLDLATLAATQYHPTRSRRELAFTIPEALRMTEEVSRRYRLLLMQHVPLVEKLNLSMVRMVYDHRDKQETLQRVWNIYRILRIFTPAGWLAEARGQLLDHVFAGLKDEVQAKLKQTLLQEVASVVIDLYSGRFKVSDEELSASETLKADQQRLAVPLEPLRVCLIGQVSAGKSSIINALLGSMVAEVNQLPSTQTATVYQAKLEPDLEAIHLVDLPGLEGKPDKDDYLLEQMLQSDVVLWVLKANQPARSLDTHFKARWQAWLDDPKQRARRQPLLLGVLNQVDRLAPQQEWQPPYDLQNPTTQKARNIRDALDYNQKLLGFQSIIPLSVSEDKPPYNLEALEKLLDQCYEQGMQVQLNRRRLEASDSFSVQEQFKRAYRLGKSLFSSSRTNKTDAIK